jgi:hypothetical protein
MTLFDSYLEDIVVQILAVLFLVFSLRWKLGAAVGGAANQMTCLTDLRRHFGLMILQYATK